MQGGGGKAMAFGKSRARMVADQETGVTFNDVAGCDEAKYELQEVVDFLRNPDRYKSLGAKPMDEWSVYRLTDEALKKLAEGT